VEGMREPLARVRRQGQDGLTPKHWFTFREDLKMCWKHKQHYVSAYGVRGIVSFVLEKIQLPATKTRYVNRLVRFLTRVIKIKYELRRGYKDPVLAGSVGQAAVSRRPNDSARVAGGQSL